MSYNERRQKLHNYDLFIRYLSVNFNRCVNVLSVSSNYAFIQIKTTIITNIGKYFKN